MKRGFTLVELMGVIIILSLLVILAAPPILEKLKKTEKDIDEASLKIIASAIDLFIDDNSDTYKNVNGRTYCITLQQLVNDGKLNDPVLNVKTSEEIDLNTLVEVKLINNNKDISINNDCQEYSEPASPELTIGMIPVIYNGTNWVKADINSDWYDYTNKQWANAVTVTSTNRSTLSSAAAGTIIPMSDINTMWVWIPRYKYAIPAGTGARSINIIFEEKTRNKSTGNAVDKNYRTHPAFTFGTTEVSGIWVGKFETTGTIGSPTVLPNTTSLRSQTVKAMYDASRTMQNNTTYGTGTDGNIHMAKDSEWGAVAYLSHSQYGINNEIYKNNSSNFYTGRSGGNIGGSQILVGGNEYISTGFYTYDGKCATTTALAPGINASCTSVGNDLSDKTLAYKSSTTGNIYGIYDTSGGSLEYVMGMYRPIDSTVVTDTSGFGATTTTGTLPTSEYWDRYTVDIAATACSGGICYGRALSETDNWYNDAITFAGVGSSWLIRGGYYIGTTNAGVFAYNRNAGGVDSYVSFRLVQLRP